MTVDKTLNSVTVEKFIAAAPETVFDAWLNPDMLMRWFHGHNTAVSKTEVDARVGGKYLIVMSEPDRDWPHRGVYTAFERPNLLAFTWHSPSTNDEETLVTVEFTAQGEGTRLTLTHEHLPADRLSGFDDGWAELLEELAEALAG